MGRHGVGPARLSGRGIGVAVIDSGVDPKHAALAGRVIASVDFTGGDGIDRFGHGTHVAAMIAGAAGRLAETADYRGIASAARIVNLRVLGDDGVGAGEQRDRGDRLGDREPEGVRHPGDQPVARGAGAAAVSRRSGVRGGGAGGGGGDRRGGGGGQLRDAAGRPAGVGRDHVAGEHPGGDHGGGGRHARDGAAVATTRWRATARAGRRGTTWC